MKIVLDWFRIERHTLINVLSEAERPWSIHTASLWLRMAWSCQQVGDPIWTPQGECRKIPGHRVCRTIFGWEGWTERQVKALMSGESWRDPYFIDAAKEERERQAAAVEAAAAKLMEVQHKGLLEQQAKDQAALATLQAAIEQLQAGAESDGNSQSLTETSTEAEPVPKASQKRPKGVPVLKSKPLKLQGRVSQKCPKSVPKTSTGAFPLDDTVRNVSLSPKALSQPEPRPPAPAPAGESQTDSPRLDTVPATAPSKPLGNVVQGLAAAGIHTIRELFEVWPAISGQHKRPGATAVGRLEAAIAAAGLTHKPPMSPGDAYDLAWEHWRYGRRLEAVQAMLETIAIRTASGLSSPGERETLADWEISVHLDGQLPGAERRFIDILGELAAVEKSPGEVTERMLEEGRAVSELLTGVELPTNWNLGRLCTLLQVCEAHALASVDADEPEAPESLSGRSELALVAGISGRTVGMLAAAGVVTVEDWWTKWPTLGRRPVNWATQRAEEVELALGAAGLPALQQDPESRTFTENGPSVVALPAHVTVYAKGAQALERLQDMVRGARTEIQCSGFWTPDPEDHEASAALQKVLGGDMSQLDLAGDAGCEALARELFERLHSDLPIPTTEEDHDDMPARQPRPAGADRRTGPKIHGRGASRRRA